MSHQPQNQLHQADEGLSTAGATTEVSLGCCRFSRFVTPALVIMTMLSITTAAYFAGRSSGDRERMNSVQWNLPPIDASASASSEKFSIATGVVSGEAEGFFVLDHNSGLAQCNIIYPRLGRFMAQFTVNVAEGLGTGGKGGKYIMVAGHADFPTSSANPAASCILYVMDSSTGNYACYGIPFSRNLVSGNRPQNGQMILLHQGTANPLIDRDNLR